MSAPAPAALPAGMKAKLTVVRGKRAGKTYAIKDGATFIGRKGPQPVDVNLDEHEIPGKVFAQNRHACVMFNKGALFVSDPGTQCGTYVNRVRLQAGKPCPLKAEDEIQIGNVALKVKVFAKKKTGSQK